MSDTLDENVAALAAVVNVAAEATASANNDTTATTSQSESDVEIENIMDQCTPYGRTYKSAEDDIFGDNENDEDDEDDMDDLFSVENIQKLSVPTKDFMTNLQDEGRLSKGENRQMEYPKIKKLAGLIYRSIKDEVDGVPKNQTTATKAITNAIVRRRIQMDVSSVLPDLHSYVKKTADQMYIVANEADGGQHHIIKQCFAYFNSRLKKNKSKRTPSVGIRLASALMDPSIREEVAKYLAGRRSRDDQNQSDKPELNFWQKVLDIFSKITLFVPRPDVMDREDVDPMNKLDPNSCDFKNRDAKWLKETWDTYLKPIYKKVLIKWFKDTGGGPRTLDNFVNYCTIQGKTHEWLVWVYAMDEKNDLLLGSRSGAGRASSLLRLEAGYEDANEGDDAFKTPAKSAKKAKSAKLAEQLETSQTLVQDLLGVMKERASATAVDPIDQGFQKMEKIDAHKRRVEVDEDHTPNSKEALLRVLKKRKKIEGKKIIELSKEDEEDV